MTIKTTNTNLPSLTGEGSLSSYLAQIKKFPMLTLKKNLCWVKMFMIEEI